MMIQALIAQLPTYLIPLIHQIQHLTKKLCRRLNYVDLSKLAYCPLRKKIAPKKSKRKDTELRVFAMESTLLDLTNSSCKGVGKADKSVNAKCCTQTGGNCVSRVQVGHVGDLRKRFWGDSSIDDFLNSKVRGEKLKKLLTEFYDNSKKQFNYKVGTLDVCERGFLILLGLISGKKTPGSQFERVKKEIMGLINKPIIDEELKSKQDLRSNIKNHVVSSDNDDA